MQLQDENILIERSEDIKESFFGILEKDSVHILSILRSKLYTNKIKAVLREYACNGWDANPHIPIDIHLPTTLNPTLKIRDYGFGLTEEEVRELYTKYGASTKRDSNEKIGCLGLGCKSGFSYSDTFTIISYYGYNVDRNTVTRDIYTAFIDETKVGKVALLSRTTDFESAYTGIEICIPVKKDDISKFSYEAQELFKHWDVKPNFTSTKIDFPNYKVLVKGSNWEIVSQIIEATTFYYGSNNYDNKNYVVMGQIGYEINIGALNYSATSPEQDLLINIIGLHLRIPIGSVAIAANREGLEYNNLTKEGIRTAITNVIHELTISIQDQINKTTSLIEAKILYFKLTNNILKNTDVIRDASINWKGQPLSNAINSSHSILVHKPDDTEGKATFYFKDYNNRFRKEHNIHLKLSDLPWKVGQIENFVVFENDFPTRHLERIKEFLESNRNTIAYVISPLEKGDALTQYFSKSTTITSLEGYSVKKLSSLPVPIINRKTSTRQTSLDLTKYSRKYFKYVEPQSSSSGDVYAASLYWENIELDIEEVDEQHVYMILDRFNWYISDSHTIKMDSASKLLKAIRTDNINIPDIYGIKIAHRDTIPTNWISFDQWLNENIIKDIVSNNQNYIMRAIELAKDVSKGLVKELISNGKYKQLFNTTNSLYNYMDTIIKYSKYTPISSSRSQLISSLKEYLLYEPTLSEIPESLDDLAQKVIRDFPLITSFHFSWGNWSSQEEATNSIEYVNTVLMAQEYKKIIQEYKILQERERNKAEIMIQAQNSYRTIGI